MLVPMKDILDHANRHNYAVMAINSATMESTKAIIAAAEAENSPVIVSISPRQMHSHARGDLMVPMVRTLAESVNIPVALNLDHGGSYEDILEAIGYGFTSVMIDASSYDFEENVQRTEMIAALAHAKGITVEGELGHVGVANAEDNEKVDLYTKVDQAAEYVKRTGIDCLAVAIGTAHGDYPKGMKPCLDFERLAQLKDMLKMPLVLHGGSGSGEENIKKVVSLGINKINVCTDVFAIARETMTKVISENPRIDYMNISMEVEKAMTDYIRQYMRLIGSSGQYNYGASKGPGLD